MFFKLIALQFVCVHVYLFQKQAGCTALIRAAWRDNTECVRLLLGAGAQMEAKDNVREFKNVLFDLSTCSLKVALSDLASLFICAIFWTPKNIFMFVAYNWFFS